MMKRSIKTVTALLCLLLGTPLAFAKSGQVLVTDLRCEYAVDPLGIDVSRPGLSWRIESDVSGQKQTGYWILVSSSLANLEQGVGDLWDSGKVA